LLHGRVLQQVLRLGILAIEADGNVGGQLYATVKPILDVAFDAASM